MTVRKTDFRGCLRRIADLPRRTKRAVMVFADIIALPVCAAVAMWLVVPKDTAWPDWLLLVTLAAGVIALRFFGFYRSVVRFMGPELIVAASKTVTLAALAIFASMCWFADVGSATRVGVVFWLLAIVYVAGSRFGAGLLLRSKRSTGDHVLIYGAGVAGAHLASAISGRGELALIGFVDDNPALHGAVINGLKAYAPSELAYLIDQFAIRRVLLALPSVSRRRRQRIINRLEQLPVHVQTIPDIHNLISGAAKFDDIRDVDIEDLLGRDPVPPIQGLLEANIQGKSVMVTGAGGSIGSELCLQIARLGPRRLVLFEVSEAALYTIDQKLRDAAKAAALDVEIVSLIGTVQRKQRVQEILATYRINVVYHAAAYKHVPLVEQNMLEGIDNNVFGTLHSAEAAIEAGVESFVLVSTDKAVKPTNVMGASKRLAELILQGLERRNSVTRFSMVRFGNVLESSGSVVPRFREQIMNGGPVTVTHPDIYRYFMTIPEAASLVLQAGSMARGGDVFVLDMGQPVRIADLAEKMIHLMGLSVRDEGNPDGDIEIEFIGLRPAEKLCEELLIGDNAMGTRHPRIMRAEEDCLEWDSLAPLLDVLWEACCEFDREKARGVLLQAVGGYSPTKEVVDLVWREQNVRAKPVNIASAAGSNVTDLRTRRPPASDTLLH